MSRKDTLKSLLGGEAPNDTEPASRVQDGDFRPPVPTLRVRTKTGPIRNLEGDLRELLDGVQAAQSMAINAAAIVELEANLIEASFIRDRLDAFDEDHQGLVDSIKDHGQQVPILVRPHPSELNKYQVVYGHRRLRACLTLGRPVKAIIRPLSDIELVVAQGQENSTRKGLSYIERAYFALRLEDGGFERSIIMAALSLQKTHLSTLISIARRIPANLISIIGPAPKAGAPRWIALADRLEKVGNPAELNLILENPTIKELNSDERFVLIFDSLQPKSQSLLTDEIWRNQQGLEVARFRRSGRKVSVIIDQTIMPDFAQYLIDHMADLYKSFEEDKRTSHSSE
jgi:ParB family chromosome partitioning protein